ncbi:Protein SABRE [Lecanora helva]
MGIFSPAFLFGLILLGYLTTFVVFAILRIATGISIQRIGYFSFRRIAYTYQDGIRIDLRALGLHLHRPTFAQPTWISLRFTELKVTVDAEAFAAGKKSNGAGRPGKVIDTPKDTDTEQSRSQGPRPILRSLSAESSRSRTWKRLTQLKERIKRLHDQIHWLRMIDVTAIDSSLVITNVGQFHIGTFSAAVDTRRKTVDRGRLFQHKKIPAGDQRPAEWILTMKGVLFTPEGKESLEVIDICNLNIHGLLYKDRPGLRDTSISLKLGRVHIPYDDLLACAKHVEECQKFAKHKAGGTETQNGDISFSDVMDELDRPGSREAKIVQTVSDSKEFVSSILRGIQEIQIAVSFVGMTKKLPSSQPSDDPLYLNVAMNEFGVDMHRLDPKSPAHRMYFSSKDIAHQALLAAISIAVSLDDGGKPERILYVPMATTTIKTTLPSKTVAFSESKNAAERNANILFANLVVTSPSIDVDPTHMPLVLTLIQRHERSDRPNRGRHHLMSRLLPKAHIKFSIHEPVVRVSLPPADPNLKDTDEYDLLILSISSISLDLESLHSTAGELHYALTSNLRVASNHLYYHTAEGERHSLLVTDAIELKVQLNASPEVCIIATGNFQTLSVHMVRPEISSGVRQIVHQLSKDRNAKLSTASGSHKQVDFLRPLPTWLVQCSLQGSNFGFEVAGVDSEVSQDARGVALQLESWTAEYKIQRSAPDGRPTSRRHGHAQSPTKEEPMIKITPPPGTADDDPSMTDGRRLAVHVRGLEGFAVEKMDVVEPEYFISLPRFEVAFSTSSDNQGPIFHVNSHTRALLTQYSLYRYYAIGVATAVLRKAFAMDTRGPQKANNALNEPLINENPAPNRSTYQQRSQSLVAIDVRADLLQVKAKMPSDPPMMLQVYRMEAGRHRWAMPYLKSQMVRLYAEAPQVPTAWARLLSVKTLRLDFRENRRKRAGAFLQENSIDVVTDFIRFAVPHQLVFHKILDNFVNAMKATEQLHHRFKTGVHEYVSRKHPEKPKIVPRISVRSKALMIDIEDGPFEWKLGSIYRAGLIEQKQRLAREEAFSAKIQNLENSPQIRGSSRYRPARPPAQRAATSSPPRREARRRSPSAESGRHRSESPMSPRSRRMRYDPEGKCRLSDDAKVSRDEAWNRLQRHNAQSWKKRIDDVYRIQNRGMRKIRDIFWGNEEVSTAAEAEPILALPERPGLMSTLISDLHVVLDKPSFPIKDYPQFLHRVGKGMPFDMQYSLLIPLSVQIDMGEARVTLRDYPLPLLHVPAIRPGQSPRLPSWSLKTDFVIAEEYRGDVSTKEVKVEVIPPEKFSESHPSDPFSLSIQRTVSPVKTYSEVEIAINTSAPTSITWGTSYQPAIQDMMMIIESFTKPQVDPSDRTGFWDKIRLSAHSRVNVAWRGDGDVRLQLKGSRDPYVVTGNGAGFMMCWRNNVRWSIHQDDDPRRFMTVDSEDYVLAIPDYSHQARETSHALTQDGESSSTSSKRNMTIFKKVIMKLSGNVRWLAGIMFERDLDHGGRSFQFSPHFDVTLRTPAHAQAPPGQEYDAFRGFRSNHIHLSIAVVAPQDRDWKTTNVKPSMSYNTVHMTPRFFTHFFDWWSLFSGVMALPVRQGKLFPGIEKSSKKFGRHLATIKYNLLLSPLFIAHMYKHKDVEDYSENAVSATGLKLRLDSFMLDLHQRREEFTTPGKDRAKQIKTSGMRINQAQLDFISADIRAVSASITGTNADDVNGATAEDLASYQQPVTTADISRFTIPDNDFSWIDMDDFVEIDWILPAETNPETKILPLAFAPRFTYFRQTDHPGNSSTEQEKSSPFGDEPTHFCVMSQDNDPRKVQCQLIDERIIKLDDQLTMHQRTLGEQELRLVRDSNRDSSLKDRYDMLNEQGDRLQGKKKFLQRLRSRLLHAIAEGKPWIAAAGDTAGLDMASDTSDEDFDKMDSTPLEGPISDFSNRFIIHNTQLKWNNSLRNIILRYVHQVSQRRGFIYYMSQKAVKFIDDIVKEQNKRHSRREDQSDVPTPRTETPSSEGAVRNEEMEDVSLEERINNLLNDDDKNVDADDPARASEPRPSSTGNLGKDISKDFTPQNTYHVRLIAPQIQLQSEKNPKSVLLVTAKAMELKMVQVMDKHRIADDVSGLVQRRFSVDMDSVQFFVAIQKTFTQFLHIYSGNRYGTPQNSAWPPWVAFETNFDFDFDPFGWKRVVQKTSASLRYDKYNTLRLKYNDEVSTGKVGGKHGPEETETRLDHLWVDFPRIRAVCDSGQYFTMYLIVLDLLLYNEPREKVRSERLEKIMLASDFSDLSGAGPMVVNLQARIRQMEEIKTYFQIHAKHLDRHGWEDRLAIEQDLANCEDELFFMMKAITTSQRKNDDRAQTSQTTGLLRWYLSASEIVWHLMRARDDPLMEIQLSNAAFDRTDNSDGSNHNTMEIGRVRGQNLLRGALYPEMIGPYLESGRKTVDGQMSTMLKVNWHSLEAIAGIPVLDHFEVDLFPLKVQLEREIGQKLFEYIFPGGSGRNGNDRSPFMVKHTLPSGQNDGDDSDTETLAGLTDTPRRDANAFVDEQQSMRPASLDMRLRATMAFPEKKGHHSSAVKAKHHGHANHGEGHHRLGLFQHSNHSSRSQNGSRPSLASPNLSIKKTSQESLTTSRKSKDGSSTNLSSLNGQPEKHKRFTLNRTNSQATTIDKEKPSDDLSQMLSRASNYMTLAYVKIPSVVLCLSYKGKGERNIEDVHNFVFRMPVLEYRNKTWSNLDLALRLKKDVIRALISHTGAIIGNKLSHRHPTKQLQGRLRESVNSSLLLSSTDSQENTGAFSSETSSIRDQSPRGESRNSNRSSYNSYPGSQLARTDSFASSIENSTPGNGFPTEAPPIPESEAEGDESAIKSMRHNFIRRFTGDTQKARRNDTDDSEER